MLVVIGAFGRRAKLQTSGHDYDTIKSVTREQQSILNAVVWVDAERMSGEPCFNGTRVPVQALIDHIEVDRTIEDFLKGFPSVTRSQAVQFIELARDNLLSCVSSS
jgi:uncharacterized protein (DUF433 family)